MFDLRQDPATEGLFAKVKSIHIMTDSVAAVRTAIAHNFQLRSILPSPLLTIVGPPLVGKSRAIAVAAGYCHCEHLSPAPGRTLVAELKSRFSADDLDRVILQQAGAPAFYSRGNARRARFLSDQLKIRRVDTLVIDNAHFLAPSGDLHFSAVDLVAHLATSSELSIVLSGRPDTRTVGAALAEATGMSPLEIAIAALPANKTGIERMEAFLLLFSEQLQQLASGLGCEVIEEETFARRMLLASRGELGFATRLVIETISIGKPTGPALVLEGFAESWRRQLNSNARHTLGVKVNPFSRDQVPTLEEIRKVFSLSNPTMPESPVLPSRPRGKGVGLWGA